MRPPVLFVVAFSTVGTLVSAADLPDEAIVERASLECLVRDARNEPIPGVSVSISGAEGSHQTVSDINGWCRLEHLPSGHYELEAELLGFEVLHQSLTLADSERLQQTLVMTVQGTEVELTLACPRIPVVNQDSQTKTLLNPEFIENTPR